MNCRLTFRQATYPGGDHFCFFAEDFWPWIRRTGWRCVHDRISDPGLRCSARLFRHLPDSTFRGRQQKANTSPRHGSTFDGSMRHRSNHGTASHRRSEAGDRDAGIQFGALAGHQRLAVGGAITSRRSGGARPLRRLHLMLLGFPRPDLAPP